MYNLYSLSPVVKWWPFVATGVLSFACVIWYRGIDFPAMGWPLPIGVGSAVVAGMLDLIRSGDLVGATFYELFDVAARGLFSALVYALIGACAGLTLGKGMNKLRSKRAP
ncbi:MAG: hypothetical protein QOE55_6750 [Acidobacteriaceae bacterium]|jgi:hypothetical protein|nr:hypothetical protein [Acidobacteriaceae bacterium]